jgi:hypothetical protein
LGNGTALPATSALGVAYSSFAESLIQQKISQLDAHRNKFLEFFSIPNPALLAHRN